MMGPYVQVPHPPDGERDGDFPIAFLDRDGVINRGKPGYVNGPDLSLIHISEPTRRI